MRRRAFITLLGGAAAWPLAARAQQAGPDLLHRRSSPSSTSCAPGASLKGQNLTIVSGRFQVCNEQLADLVPPMVKAAPDAIRSAGDVITRALLKATWTIPIMGGPRIEKRRARRPSIRTSMKHSLVGLVLI